MKPVLLVLIVLSGPELARLAGTYELLVAPTASERSALIGQHGPRIQLELTNGTEGLRSDEIDLMPLLTLICAQGAGHENIACDHARARGVVLANGAGANDDCVADHALALLLAAVRAVPQFDHACRQGRWRDGLPLRPQLAGKRMGLLGLGRIGRKIARRGAAFDLEIAYQTRSSHAEVPYRHFAISPVCRRLRSGAMF